VTTPQPENGTRIDHLIAVAAKARSEGNRSAELGALAQIEELDQNNTPKLMLRRGQAFIVHELYDDVVGVLEQLQRLEPNGFCYRQLLLEYLASLEQADDLYANLLAWSESSDSSDDLTSILLSAWTYTGDAKIFALFKQACRSADRGVLAASMSATFHIQDPIEFYSQGQKLEFQLRQLGRAVDLAEGMIDFGHIEQAKSFTHSMINMIRQHETGPNRLRRALEELGRICDSWVRESDLPRSLLKEDYASDFICSPAGEPRKLAVVFTGWNGRPLVGSRILDNHLAQLGYQTIIVRDAHSVGFGRGIKSLGSDRPTTLEALDRKLSELGASDPLFIGTSIGTFGAVSHGLPLGVRRFALFGPVSSAGDREFLHGIGDYRGGVLLNRTSRNIPVGERLMADFMNRAHRSFRMKLIVGAQNRLDVRYAQSIADFDGVETIQIPDYAEHNTVRGAISRGIFDDIIDQA
jgi:hypothetical protein